MPETDQLTWTHKELLVMMVRGANLHEGKWQLLINFMVGPSVAGPAPDQAVPTMMVGIANIGIQRVPQGANPPEHLYVDAATVNPEKS